MKLVKPVVLMSCIFILTLSSWSCKNVSNTKEDTTGSEKVEEKKEDVKDSEQILGIWSNEKKGLWFEFMQGNKFNSGKSDSLIVENNNWTINEESKQLVVYSNAGAKYFNYKIKENELYLMRQGRKREMLFVRIATRPDL